MHLIFQIFIIFIFTVIFYTIIVVSLIRSPITGMTGVNNLGKIVRFRNKSTGKYLSLGNQGPILVNSENLRDPATLFRINYEDEYIELQSIYNDRFLAVINGEVTSVINSKTNETWFSLIFNNSTLTVAPSSGGFLSAGLSNEIIIDQSSEESQWMFESLASFLI